MAHDQKYSWGMEGKKILVQQSHLISVKWEGEKENRDGKRENGTEEVKSRKAGVWGVILTVH